MDVSIDDQFLNIFEIFEQFENKKLYTKKDINRILSEERFGTSIDELCLVYKITHKTLTKWKEMHQLNH